MKNYLEPTSAFEKLYDSIIETGIPFAGTKALMNVSFSVEIPSINVITTPWRKFNKAYAEAEWKWYLSGNRDASSIAKRAPLWESMMVPGTKEVNSNYGYFWQNNDQLLRVIEELRRNPSSRRAMIVHYDISELDRYQYDTPCNVVLNFYILDRKLHMTIFARSIDLIYGFCNDQYIFSKLQLSLANELGLNNGNMHWFITNLHIYEKHYNLKGNE
jgi:thymidylate synthase